MLDTQARLSHDSRMNKLPPATRVQILSMLCEGSSMRSIGRVADVSTNTVNRYLVIAGKVENVEYGGHDSLIDVRVGEGVVLHARATGRLKAGDDVKLTIAPQRVLVYPAESA